MPNQLGADLAEELAARETVASAAVEIVVECRKALGLPKGVHLTTTVEAIVAASRAVGDAWSHVHAGALRDRRPRDFDDRVKAMDEAILALARAMVQGHAPHRPGGVSRDPRDAARIEQLEAELASYQARETWMRRNVAAFTTRTSDGEERTYEANNPDCPLGDSSCDDMDIVEVLDEVRGLGASALRAPVEDAADDDGEDAG